MRTWFDSIAKMVFLPNFTPLNKIMIKNILRPFSLAAFLLILLTAGKPKDLKEVILDDLINETQFTLDKDSEDALRIVWWIPTEFWATIYAKDPSIDEDAAAEIVSSLEKYTMVIVIDGDMTAFGDLKSKSSSKIRKGLKVIDADGKEYSPMDDEDIDFGAKMVLNMMKPMFSNLLGKMGESMELMMFQKDEVAILNPFEDAGSINYGGESLDLNLPLSSLMEDKICPTDDEKMNSKWKYCPIHGVKLDK